MKPQDIQDPGYIDKLVKQALPYRGYITYSLFPHKVSKFICPFFCNSFDDNFCLPGTSDIARKLNEYNVGLHFVFNISHLKVGNWQRALILIPHKPFAIENLPVEIKKSVRDWMCKVDVYHIV